MTDTPPTNPNPTATPAPASTPTPPTTSAAPDKNSDWRLTWSDEYQKDPSLNVFKDFDSLAKSYKHAISFNGMDKADLIKKPKSLEDKEGWDNYYKAIGRPENPDGYSIPKELEGAKDKIKPLAEALHKAGANNDVFTTVVNFMSEQAKAIQAESAKAQEQMVEKNASELKRLWGDAFESKKAEVKALTASMPEPVQKQLEESGFMLNPEFLNWLAIKVAPGLREDKTIASDGRGSGIMDSRPMTPQEATLEWNRLQSDKDFINKLVSGDAYAKEKQTKIFAYMYPKS